MSLWLLLRSPPLKGERSFSKTALQTRVEKGSPPSFSAPPCGVLHTKTLVSCCRAISAPTPPWLAFLGRRRQKKWSSRLRSVFGMGFHTRHSEKPDEMGPETGKEEKNSSSAVARRGSLHKTDSFLLVSHPHFPHLPLSRQLFFTPRPRRIGLSHRHQSLPSLPPSRDDASFKSRLLVGGEGGGLWKGLSWLVF